MNTGWVRQVLAVSMTALVLGAGLVLAAQGPARSELAAMPTAQERQPLWVPGTDVPMATYLQPEHAALPAPPR